MENNTDKAYEHLRRLTMRFGFRPGERISEVEVAKSLGMSRAPVREALSRLYAEGLVGFNPGKGSFCRRLSASEILDLLEVRFDLELGAAKRLLVTSEDQFPAEEVENLRASSQQALQKISLMTIDQIVEIDESFYLALVRLARNEERIKIAVTAAARLQFFRYIYLGDQNRASESLRTHIAICDMLLSDRTEGLETLFSHNLMTADEVKVYINTALATIFADQTV